jgi:hypothetical protein
VTDNRQVCVRHHRMILKRQSGSVHVSNHDKIPTQPSHQRHDARCLVKPPILPAVAVCAVSKPGLATRKTNHYMSRLRKSSLCCFSGAGARDTDEFIAPTPSQLPKHWTHRVGPSTAAATGG